MEQTGSKKPQSLEWALHASEDLATRLEAAEIENVEEGNELIRLAWDIAYAIRESVGKNED